MESAGRHRYTGAMKTPPDNPEFVRFTEAMKTIMKVPKTAVITKKPKPPENGGTINASS